MTVVKSPYNFLPAPKGNEVFYPDWANQVNQDIPFSDGESGEIEFTITAETPIFIRNGHSANQETDEFSHYVDKDGNKRYFIPATSVKGMVRNVLEIVANSKLTQINDHKHSVRQIMRTEGTVIDEGYELSQDENKRVIKCGYLIKKNDRYYIYSCGKPLKIRYTDLDQKFKCDFDGQFGVKDKANIRENFDHRTAAYKYELLEGEELENSFEIHPLDEDDKQKSWVSKFQPLQYARFSQDIPGVETFEGTIVLVGQASNYNISTSRKGEYVFRGVKKEILENDNNRIEVSKEKIKDFKFVNRDGEGENIELKDWGYWKSKIKEGIPVFFRERVLKGEKEIVDFGLSFMYKQPAMFGIKDLLPKYSDKNDLTEILFGRADKGNSLKGRVFFGNAKCVDDPKVLNKVKVTLSSPRSSFTPFYLLQKGNLNRKVSSFNTYNKFPKGELRGFKRYPVKSTTIPHEGVSEAMQTQFKPLDKNTQFKCKIRFHNLRKLEIGALLYSISLGQVADVYQNLGYAKPLGYGVIKISDLNTGNCTMKTEDYIEIFEVEMMVLFGDSWTTRIEELLTMSRKQKEDVEKNLTYNDLKDFQEIKNEGLYLRPYSELAEKVELTNRFTWQVKKRSTEIAEEKIEQKHKIHLIEEDLNRLITERKYEQALIKLNELNRMAPVVNFEERADSLYKAIAESRKEKQIEYLLNEGTLEELEYFKQENSFHQRIGEINKRINELKPIVYPEQYHKVDIRRLLKDIPKAIEKNKIDSNKFADELFNDFKRALFDGFQNKRFRKEWENFDDKHTWGKVSNILGKERAQDIFNTLNIN